jgi:3-methyladenine DNA glycosylase Tag
MKTFNSIREETLEEKLKASDPTGKYISDFVHSDNPKFAGKTKKERIRMALGASYGAKKTNEAKDSREYDYEGDMAKSQLRSIIANAQTVHDMLEDNTNLAEWVQSKITLSADYISTVRDYMQSNKDVNEEVETTHEDPLVLTKDSEGNIHTHANLSVANAIHGTDVKHQAIHTGMPVQAGKFTFELSKHHASQVKEAKEKTEYDYEGDMARGQLQSIIMNAQRVHDMLEDNDNLPEWVQSKITLAEDYISTVSNYMSSEIDEAALNELSPKTLQNYKVASHKKYDDIRNKTDSNSMVKKAKLEKGIKTATAKQYPNPASTPAPKADPNSRGYEKGRYMGDSVEQDDENQIDELKSSTYQSYVNKVTDPKVASKRGNTQKGVPKSIKAIGGVTKAIGKQNFAARLASAASRNF